MISQTLGTFSIGLNGEISFDFNGNDSTITDFGEMSFNQPVKISQKLIDEAERIYTESNTIQCIYDLSDKITINKFYAKSSKIEDRDIKIDLILDDRFYIGPWYELSDMPSRTTYYDTVTKQFNLFERHKSVLNYMNSIGFRVANLLDFENDISDQELLWDSYQRETAYCSKIFTGIIVRVKSNLMVEMSVIKDGQNKKNIFFYNPNQILNSINEIFDIGERRELKIKNILNYDTDN